MSEDDLRARIVQAAPRPGGPVDATAVRGRARRLRQRRSIAVGAGTVAAVGVVAAVGIGLQGRSADLRIGPDPAGSRSETTSPSQVRIVDPVDDVIARTDLVAFDVFERPTVPPPSVQAVLNLPTCDDASGLAGWAAQALAPFGGVDGDFRAAALADVADTTPIRRVDATLLSCTVAGTIGETEVWELRGIDGTVVGRGAGSEGLAGEAAAISTRQDQLGGINFGSTATASGQHVAGVWRDEVMELELSEIEPRRNALLIVQWPSDPLPADTDMQLMGQRMADARAGELTTTMLDLPDYRRPLPVPRALPAGFVRCAGPFANGGFQAYDTELCNDAGQIIRVSTDNKGGNPVPDPPTSYQIDEIDGQLVIAIITPVEDVTVTMPAELGRQTAEAMAQTIPLLDRRVWTPDKGRDHDLADAYSRAWWQQQLEAAGATDITITDGPVVCSGVERISDDDAGEGGCSTTFMPPLEGSFTDPEGAEVEFHVWSHPVTDDATGAPASGPWPASYAVTVGDTDVLISDGYSPAIRAVCGGVFMTLRPDGVGRTFQTDWNIEPSLQATATILTQLNC